MSELAITPDQNEWTPAQKAVLVAAGIKPSSPEEGLLFLSFCQRTGLDPLSRQVYLMQGKPFVSIDGLRLIAERTGQYRGQTVPEWCGEDGVWTDVWLSSSPPAAARVGVLREGYDRPVFGVATWSEFGSNKGTWAKMPSTMLAKVAESQSLRRAFPADLSGVYSGDEMEQATVQQPKPAVPPRKITVESGPVVDEETGEVIPEAELLPLDDE